MEITLRYIDRRELSGFRQYLLPTTAMAVERENGDVLAIGAVSGRHSVGAAAAVPDGANGAALTDLFVDEAVRGNGIGGALLKEIMDILAEVGVEMLSADYTLKGEELAAMDALMRSAGFTAPALRSRTFMALSKDYVDHGILGAAFTPGWKTPKDVRTFSELTEEQLGELLAAEDIPEMLSWRLLRGRAEPELSVALVLEGRVAAYLLCEESQDGGFVLMSVVRREGAPITAFTSLLTDMLSRCFYWRGGHFPFYFSAINEHTERLAQGLMRGKCVEYEEHVCSARLSVPKGTEDGAEGETEDGEEP